MNPEWSRLNGALQTQLKQEATFPQGIDTLLTLRRELMAALLDLKETLRREDFDAMPFPKANGYHSKTIAYSLWHIFRIEDIVAHDLICRDDEVFRDFRDGIGAPIIPTGNELAGGEIAAFSRAIDLDALYAYAAAVKTATDGLLRQLSYRDLRRKFGDEDKARLRSLQVVSADERACWLIDCWCGKNVRGLIQMPFSRHWIMHVEASLRIRNKLWEHKMEKTTCKIQKKSTTKPG